jgi:hypothetical protein
LEGVDRRMKRTIYIVVAALLVLLFYPSTHPFAKSPIPVVQSGPSVIPAITGDGPPIAYANDDDDDDGDADDITGSRNGHPVGSFIGYPGQRPVLIIFKMWWNFLIWVR